MYFYLMPIARSLLFLSLLLVFLLSPAASFAQQPAKKISGVLNDAGSHPFRPPP